MASSTLNERHGRAPARRTLCSASWAERHVFQWHYDTTFGEPESGVVLGRSAHVNQAMWVGELPLGSADGQKPAVDGTVEAWARSPGNPVGGWYGLKKGLRGRFANYVPPVMEALGLAEAEYPPRNNRMRAL